RVALRDLYMLLRIIDGLCSLPKSFENGRSHKNIWLNDRSARRELHRKKPGSRGLPCRRSYLAYLFPVSLVLVMELSDVAVAQNASWTTETVDKLSSRGVSLAVDKEGNLHVSYVTDEGDVKYAFRSAGSVRWFTMNITKGLPYYGHGGGMFTRITVD